MTSTDATVPPKRRDRASRGLFMILGLIVVVIVVGLLVFLFTGNAEESAQPAAEDPHSALADAITAEVEGAVVEFEPGLAAVTFPLPPDATPAAASQAAQDDSISILRAVQDSEWSGTVEITAYSAAGDQPGGQEMVRMVYLPETVERIDPDGIGREDVWAEADEQFVDPALAG
ncbi:MULTISPECIES: hypothetical protein [unclassified Dietzia]|uniref:hypothetical protein n=1 Tax=unclassified Dietzia TaxID=2617939 RepID=UPI0015FD1227|nr:MULTISPECIES: hypothetical protein [unclassified Dietzia]MBB1024630.1 hypothetical protein [Dietzia sp. DQ12-76]MBB1029218.1 hypothetical protein [Dietzia sp. DQ11-38-2]